MTHTKQINVIGWFGVLFIFVAFTLTTFELINATNILYSLLNFTGALGILISSYVKKDFQPVILNVLWLFVAVIGIVKSVVHL